MTEQEKQIKEMAKVLNECCNRYDENGNHIGNKCYECEEWSDDNHCCCSYNTKEATALYNAGYRKQVEAEWIYVHTYLRGRCSVCNSSMQYDKQPYCSNCGAKMKGE